jgi:hypothetical protein
MMAFQAVQRQFLAHLRNPGQQPLPTGFAQQGVALYTDLLVNKFNDSLTTCFPVTHALLGEKAWQQMLKGFIARHRCLSPYYRQIPDEFIQYLQTEWVNHTGLPYLLELAHFEWVELILAITDAEPVVKYDMMLALRGTEAALNVWHTEKRNVRADLQKLFGEDFRSIDAVALMTDTDNSRGQASAFYGDIWFSKD